MWILSSMVFQSIQGLILCVLLGLHFNDQIVKHLERVGRLRILVLGITVLLQSIHLSGFAPSSS